MRGDRVCQTPSMQRSGDRGVDELPRSLGRRLPRTISRPIHARRRAASRRRQERAFADALAASAEDVRIHLGAGGVRLPGWLDTDVTSSAPYFLDATKPWPVPEASVSLVYGDNVIEHLDIEAGRRLLRYARSARRAGGVIRLATPDARNTAAAYVSRDSDLDSMLERHRRHGYRVDHPVDLLRITFATGGHWRGYIDDEEALASELHGAGFIGITRCRVGESAHNELRGLESRGEPIDDALQLVLEATVPVAATGSRKPPP